MTRLGFYNNVSAYLPCPIQFLFIQRYEWIVLEGSKHQLIFALVIVLLYSLHNIEVAGTEEVVYVPYSRIVGPRYHRL